MSRPRPSGDKNTLFGLDVDSSLQGNHETTPQEVSVMKSHRPHRCETIALALGTLAIATLAWAADPPKIDLSGGDAARGKEVAMDRGKGNCIACHLIPGGESPGAIGPALIAMQARYPSKDALAIQIWDATVKAPEAAMPPFGRHEILSKQEFADVVEYIWSL